MIDEFREMWKNQDQSSDEEEYRIKGLSKSDKFLIDLANKMAARVDVVKSFIFKILVSLKIADPNDEELKDAIGSNIITFGSLFIALILQFLVLKKAFSKPTVKENNDTKNKSADSSKPNSPKTGKKKSKKIN